MNMELSRRRFMQGASAGLAGTTLGALGFGDIEAAYATSIRAWKLAGTNETRNTCTYCAVGCGIIMYSKGNLAKGETAEIVHIEGDPDHPTNRGTLCPERSGTARLGACQDPHPLPANPQTRLRQVRARVLGHRARSRRTGDEGRPRQEHCGQEQRWHNGEPVDLDRLPGGISNHQ